MERVFPVSRKSGKKTTAIGRSISGEPGTDTKTNKVVAQPPNKGPKGQPNGQGAQRCDSPNSTRCKSPGLKSGTSTCPSWTKAGGYDPNLYNFNLETDKPSEGVGEEWWEILFEDIGILPILQPLYSEGHTYALEEFSGETPGDDEMREMGFLA